MINELGEDARIHGRVARILLSEVCSKVASESFLMTWSADTNGERMPHIGAEAWSTRPRRAGCVADPLCPRVGLDASFCQTDSYLDTALAEPAADGSGAASRVVPDQAQPPSARMARIDVDCYPM